VARDTAEAFTWAKRAFDAGSIAGSIAGMALAGRMLLGGHGVARDEAAGLALLRAAADAGQSDAQYEMGYHCLHTQHDAVTAAGWFRRAAEGGVLAAMEWLCVTYINGAPGVPQNRTSSYEWAARGAEAGSAVCQSYAGHALVYGEGVTKDEAAGVAWLRRAADAGLAEAQLNLYCCYRDGVAGLRADDPAALACLRAAAEGGCPDAQTILSHRLRAGDGMPADVAAANDWLRRAAEGSATAQVELGSRLLHGRGVPTDTVAGVELLRRAVEANSPRRARRGAGWAACGRGRGEGDV
jgi:hypothetical protein